MDLTDSQNSEISDVSVTHSISAYDCGRNVEKAIRCWDLYDRPCGGMPLLPQSTRCLIGNRFAAKWFQLGLSF